MKTDEKPSNSVALTTVPWNSLSSDLWRNILLLVDDKSDGLIPLEQAKTVCKQWHIILKQSKFPIIFLYF